MSEEQKTEREATPQKHEEGELFHSYEIKSWEMSPRIYKILGVSAVVNLLFLFTFAQANVLTMKGCESPFVGRVCQVLDTVYVGTLLMGTEREYVDVAYDRIDLGDAEITMIDVSNVSPPLDYPEGYFQIANPEMFTGTGTEAVEPGFLAPGIPASPGGGMFSQAPQLPRSNPNAVSGGDVDSPFKVEGDETETANNGRGTKPPLSGDTNANTDEQVANANTNPVPTPNNVNPTDPVTGVEINKRPLVDLGNSVNERLAKNEVDLTTEFTLNARGKLDKNGRLDPKSFRYINATSTDEDMIDVVKESIEAINVAGYLAYLKDLSGKDIDLTLSQDLENISALIQSEMESETRARSVKSILELGLSVAIRSKQGENQDQNDLDDLELLKGATIETQGKKVIIKFNVPKEVAHPMIQRKLAEQAAEAQKPNGNAAIKPADTNASK